MYTHSQVLMLSLCVINQINIDNLWLQFDTKAYLHFIYLSEIANEMYLSLLKPIVPALRKIAV